MKIFSTQNYLGLILLVSITLFFFHLGDLFVNIMEARNFITAKEMLNYNNWVLTTMNLEPRYEKPPFPTWLSAITGFLFGMKNIFALRLPAALSGVFMVLMLYFLSIKLLNDKKQALINALVLATSFYIIFIAREGTWDVFTHSFMLGGIWFLFQFFQTNEHKWRNSIIASLFIGLSFMSKGPVGIFALLIPFLLAYTFIFRFKDFHKKWSPLLIGFLIILIISSWWPLMVYFSNINAAEFIANKEFDAWKHRHIRPWYNYWSFPVQTGIWAIPAIISLVYPYLKKRVSNIKVYQFALLWTLIAVILLSLVPEKKERYLVPVLIPLAINIGFYIEYLIYKGKYLTNKVDLIPAYFGFGIIGVIGIVFPIVGYVFLKDGLNGFWVWYILTSIFAVSIGAYLLLNLWKKNFKNVFYSIVTFQVIIILFGFPLVKSMYNNDQFRSLTELHEIEKTENIEIYYYKEIAPELLWDYDGVLKNIFKHQGEQIVNTTSNSFGILVMESDKEAFLSHFSKDYIISNKVLFDINYMINKEKLHRGERLRREFYILKKINPQ